MTFKRALPLDELAPERPRTVKLDGRQIAVFRLTGDEVRAVDNLCPHEGYPLASGTVKDGLLTCEWHNWKFRLCDGVCVKGGEDVRSYPVRIEDGAVWLDLDDPPAAEAVADEARRRYQKIRARFAQPLPEAELQPALRVRREGREVELVVNGTGPELLERARAHILAHLLGKAVSHNKDPNRKNALKTVANKRAKAERNVRLWWRYRVEGLTLEEAGATEGLVRERVRQIEAQALSRLRHPTVRRKLRDYLGE